MTIPAERSVHGLEKNIWAYVAHEVLVFREVRRVLAPHGLAFVNLGDSYTSGGRANYGTFQPDTKQATHAAIKDSPRPEQPAGLKPKDLCGIPWRVAYALQADGWWLRQDVIWCLSGGTWVYARTQKGDMPVMVRDLYRLQPHTVRLWNGKEWTPLVGMSKSKRCGTELEIVLRSGERISCTPTHRWPSSRGIVPASELQVGDRLFSCQLPQPVHPRDSRQIDADVAWFAGLYLAEGSRSEDTIQIAGHAKEEQRWQRVEWIARNYGGSATRTVEGNKMSIRVYGKILNALVDQFVSGRTAHDKCFSPCVWKYSNDFVRAMLQGYLEGDGHWDEKNDRWRLGFCRNYNLERDLRTACARLGYRIILNLATVGYNGKRVPTFRGEIRMHRSGHPAEKDACEIVEIRKARCREVYDLGVMDEPHELALASGVLTHNSKPNPMPESVTDRCTKAHEYVFHLAKSADYYWDQEEIREEPASNPNDGRRGDGASYADIQDIYGATHCGVPIGGRNRRSVWTITTQGTKDAHFATFSPKLVEPMILAGCPREVCTVCGKPRERILEKNRVATRPGMNSKIKTVGPNSRMVKNRDPAHAEDRSRVDEWDSRKAIVNRVHHESEVGNRDPQRHVTETQTVGWTDCGHNSYRPGRVLDPFGGSGTTGAVAAKLKRDYCLIEMNPAYVTDIASYKLQEAERGVPVEEAKNGQLALFGSTP